MFTNPAAPLLQLAQLELAHDGLLAVRGVSLDLYAGEMVCLIGANGAGKSTTLTAIAGLMPVLSGGLNYLGESIACWSADRRVRAGIALVPEGRGIFTHLSVAENLRLGAYSRQDRAAVEEDFARICERMPQIRERLGQAGGTLSGGEQQMLAIARAWMSRPRLLLLDEPSMGLAPRLVEAVFALIEEIRADGSGVLLVEQNARLALQRASRAYVMAAGKIVLEGSAVSLREHPAVRAGYLGEIPTSAAEPRAGLCSPDAARYREPS